jgi:NAD-dependent deacetylase
VSQAPIEVVVVCGGPERADLPVVTAETWASHPAQVQQVCDELRVQAAMTLPSPVHEALVRLQQVIGVDRCTLATTAVDGQLQKAGAEEVIELRGSVFRLGCSAVREHPQLVISGLHRQVTACVECGAPLRPQVALPGERHFHWPELVERIAATRRVVWIDVDEVVARTLAKVAAREPTTLTLGIGGGMEFADQVLSQPADIAVPQLVQTWLG